MEEIDNYIATAQQVQQDLNTLMNEAFDKKTPYKFKLKLVFAAYKKSVEHEKIMVEGLLNELNKLRLEQEESLNNPVS